MHCAQLVMRVKRIAGGPLTTHQILAQSVQPFPGYGKRVRTCCCTTLNFVKRSASRSLTMHQISAQTVQPVPRHGKEGASARAHVRPHPIHDLRKTHRYLVSKHTSNFVTIGRALLSRLTQQVERNSAVSSFYCMGLPLCENHCKSDEVL